MIKKFSTTLGIARGSISTLNNDKQFWADNEILANKIATINADVSLALQLSQQIDSLNASVLTMMLNNQFDLVINSTSILCYKTQIFARETKNDYVLKTVNFTPKKLEEGTREKALDRCNGIVTTAESIIEQLIPHGISLDELASIHQQINDCRQTEASRISMQSEKVNLHRQLNECMARIRNNFLILDKMIIVYLPDANAVQRYQSSRRTKAFNRGKTSKKKTTQAVLVNEVY